MERGQVMDVNRSPVQRAREAGERVLTSEGVHPYWLPEDDGRIHL